MRLLAELGLPPLLLRAGQLIEQIELRVNSNVQLLKLPFPAVSITQAVFEEALLQVIKAVRREQIKASFLQDEHWEPADWSSIHAEFVIGADGRASHVRQTLGLRTEIAPAERYAMFEFPSEVPPEPRLVISGDLSHSMSPLVDRRARCSFQLASGAPATADLAFLTTLLAERAPQQTAPRELHWSGIVDFEPALVEAFGGGRVWLAGDAAHTASPLGVHSMTRGLCAVWQLVDAMAAVSAGKQPLTALESLGRGQRQDWLRTLTNDAHFELLPRAPDWLSGQARRVVSALPASGPDLVDLLAQLGIARRSQA